MSALGQKQTLPPHFRMSALPPKADIERDVRFVPEAKVGNSKGVMAVATSRWTMKLPRRVFSLGCGKNFSRRKILVPIMSVTELSYAPMH
jgi:hypothetical protein